MGEPARDPLEFRAVRLVLLAGFVGLLWLTEFYRYSPFKAWLGTALMVAVVAWYEWRGRRGGSNE